MDLFRALQNARKGVIPVHNGVSFVSLTPPTTSQVLQGDTTQNNGIKWGTLANASLAPTWSSFTPALVQGGTVAAGTVNGRYCQIGKIVHVLYNVTITDPTGAVAGNFITVGLPVTAAANIRVIGTGWLYDASAVALYSAIVDLNTSTTTALFREIDSVGALGSGAKFALALAVNDIISFSATYEAA
jgi:hypothetical protein